MKLTDLNSSSVTELDTASMAKIVGGVGCKSKRCAGGVMGYQPVKDTASAVAGNFSGSANVRQGRRELPLGGRSNIPGPLLDGNDVSGGIGAGEQGPDLTDGEVLL